MRRILTFLSIFAGTVLCVFVFNIVLYSAVPTYRYLLAGFVADDNIPTVTVTDVPKVQEDINLDNAVIEPEVKPDSYYKITYINNDSIPLDDQPAEAEHVIVDKEYHEDCGTGKGYWVITYDDGTTEIE
ncbi:MAG: hypothetical protein J6L93_01635 [Butyrivibrio sp.]|nr:hypothetical protein [Butyrivibrio sp.]